MQIQHIGSTALFQSLASRTQQPVIVIHGAADQVTPPASFEAALSPRFKRCKASTVQSCSHQVMQEEPDAVNSVISNYMTSLLN